MRAFLRAPLQLCTPLLLGLRHPTVHRGGTRWLMTADGFVPSRESADTIFALSSGAGRAGVSVIRVSGPQARDAITQLAPVSSGELPPPRRAVLRSLVRPPADGDDGGGGGGDSTWQPETIDQSLVLWFPGPRSFTGEDVVEFHTHGSRAVVAAVLEALGTVRGLRLAEAGEFTRQSFMNGKMELTQVEGLSDLINADTEEQRKQALAQMSGVQRRRYEGWRQSLLKSLAYTEALIDFGEDADDVTVDALGVARADVRALGDQLRAQLSDGRRGEVVREGVRVAIVGPPNAGKSTLLNLLAQREAAIVSPIAGTTRDVVRVTLQLGGLPVELADTAGLREKTDDPIEVLGMRRAADEARRAHVQLWVCDAAAPPRSLQLFEESTAAAGDAGAAGWAAEAEAEVAAEREEGEEPLRLLVHNKVDTLAAEAPRLAVEGLPGAQQWWVSCTTQAGLQPFLDALSGLVATRYGAAEAGEPALITRARHREHVGAALDALDAFERLAAQGEAAPLDLAAEELRTAANELGRISGRVDVEELLDVIFRDFCIGK